MADDYYSLSGPQRRRLLEEALAVHGWICCICGLSIAPGDESLQHINARSRGGQRARDNERPAHKRCNFQLQDRETDGPAGELHKGLDYWHGSRLDR